MHARDRARHAPSGTRGQCTLRGLRTDLHRSFRPLTLVRLILSYRATGPFVRSVPRLHLDVDVVPGTTKACRTGRWWPEPLAFPLDFDCSPAEERSNPGTVSVGFRVPWVTLGLSAAILLAGGSEVRPRSVGERIEIYMATRAWLAEDSGCGPAI